MKKIAAFAGIALVLTGCVTAPPTLRQLRQKPGSTHSFVLHKDYQSVYRAVLTQARGCLQAGIGGGGQLAVNGDLFPNLKSGEITVGIVGALGSAIYNGIDVREIADGQTEVRTYSWGGNGESSTALIRSWAEGSENCRL